MEKEILITASIGMFKVDGNYFLQVITADKYKFYNVQLTREQALDLADAEDIEIEEIVEVTPGKLLGGDIH